MKCHSISAHCALAVLGFVAATGLAALTAPAAGDVLLRENFDDGEIDPTLWIIDIPEDPALEMSESNHLDFTSMNGMGYAGIRSREWGLSPLGELRMKFNYHLAVDGIPHATAGGLEFVLGTTDPATFEVLNGLVIDVYEQSGECYVQWGVYSSESYFDGDWELLPSANGTIYVTNSAEDERIYISFEGYGKDLAEFELGNLHDLLDIPRWKVSFNGLVLNEPAIIAPGEAWIDTFIINTGEFVGADPTQAPDVPSDVTATQGDFSSKVRVSWEPVHEAPQYRIYRRSDDADWTHVGTTENASFSDFDAEPGVEYRYYVKSTSVGGTSAKSEVVEGWVRGKPAAPADLEASAGEFSTKVRVEWDAVFNATSYRVYRRAPGDSGWTHVDTITGLVWNDFDVDPGDEYRYSVKARNSAGTSPRSNVETGFAGGD